MHTIEAVHQSQVEVVASPGLEVAATAVAAAASEAASADPLLAVACRVRPGPQGRAQAGARAGAEEERAVVGGGRLVVGEVDKAVSESKAAFEDSKAAGEEGGLVVGGEEDGWGAEEAARQGVAAEGVLAEREG